MCRTRRELGSKRRLEHRAKEGKRRLEHALQDLHSHAIKSARVTHVARDTTNSARVGKEELPWVVPQYRYL